MRLVAMTVIPGAWGHPGLAAIRLWVRGFDLGAYRAPNWDAAGRVYRRANPHLGRRRHRGLRRPWATCTGGPSPEAARQEPAQGVINKYYASGWFSIIYVCGGACARLLENSFVMYLDVFKVLLVLACVSRSLLQVR